MVDGQILLGEDFQNDVESQSNELVSLSWLYQKEAIFQKWTFVSVLSDIFSSAKGLFKKIWNPTL